MKNVNFEYDLKQEVAIKDLNVKGYVVAYYYGDTGIQYRVAYFLKGESTTTYLYPEQIGLPEKDTKFGFNE